MSARIRRVGVVVPAHNEQALLPGCLRSLRRAAERCPVPVEVVVVADACDDGTAQVVAPVPGLSVITVNLRNVGAARAIGVAAAMRDHDPRGLWIATTDADTLVGPDWLARQIAHAERGADLVLGTVEARDWSEWGPAVAEEYQRRYEGKVSATGHSHVHGANLGVFAPAYLAAGGFLPATSDEDVALVHAVRAAGGRVVTALDAPVRTSTRRDHRAPNGFGDHLHSLAVESLA